MNLSPLLEELLHPSSHLSEDIKAETLIHLAQKAGLGAQDYRVIHDGAFKRPYSKDIAKISVELDGAEKEYLRVVLNRDGIYDALPEGLFHEVKGLKSGFSASKEMRELHRKEKQRETGNRNFFAPFEQVFFEQRLELETLEMNELTKISEGLLQDYFEGFWRFQEGISEQLAAKLLYWVPHREALIHEPELGEQLLAAALGEPIRFVQKVVEDKPISCETVALGENRLGLDTLLDGTCTAYDLGLEVEIGPLTCTEVTDYLEGGCFHPFLEKYFSLFLPVDVEVHTRIIPDASSQRTHKETPSSMIMGYTFCLEGE